MSSLDKIEHIVVVMFENRSFDNLLGWLYDPENDAPFNVVPDDFEGLSRKQKVLTNVDPTTKAAVPVSKTEDVRGPQPNPGEPFEDVYSQIYDVDRPVFENIPPAPNNRAAMGGFI